VRGRRGRGGGSGLTEHLHSRLYTFGLLCIVVGTVWGPTRWDHDAPMWLWLPLIVGGAVLIGWELKP